MLVGILGLALLWMTRGRDFAAGLLLALCSIKFHMFLLLPLVLLIHRRWAVLRGGLVGGAILLAIASSWKARNGFRSIRDSSSAPSWTRASIACPTFAGSPTAIASSSSLDQPPYSLRFS